MSFCRLALVCCLLLCAQISTGAASQYETVITSVTVDGMQVPQSLWGSVVIDTASIVKFEFMCLDKISAATGVRYQVELDNGDQNYSTSQYEPSKTFVNLPAGRFSFVIRAQSISGEWSAVPATFLFVVDAERAASFRKSVHETTSGSSSTELISPPLANVLAVVSLVMLVIAIVLFAYSRKKPARVPVVARSPVSTPAPKPASSPKEVQSMAEANQSQRQRDEVAVLMRDNDRLNKLVLEIQKRVFKSEARNKDLESQLDRVTKVKRELEELQRQKDEVFAIIVHDIKNPAYLIKNLVDLLRGYDLNSIETQEVMQDIIDTTTKIVSLSQELSNVMALDHADIKIELLDADPLQIVTSVCRRNAATAEKKGIAIRTETGTPIPGCKLDAPKIEEVIDNLVSNAIKFSLPGTTITVRLTGHDSYFTIDVEDQGLGMSNDDIQRAFQRGAKLSARPTGNEASSGLGLWIVKRLVEAHGGQVSVKSEFGIGTTFTVLLPNVMNGHTNTSDMKMKTAA